LTARWQEAGLHAAKASTWDEAIACFRRAHDSAPRRAEPVYNLALAYDRAERPLVAICWYEIFLCVAREGATRKQVENRIAALERKIRSDVHELIDSARKLESLDGGPELEPDVGKISLLRNAALVEAALGEGPKALALLDELRETDKSDLCWSETGEFAAQSLAVLSRADAEGIASRLSAPRSDRIRELLAGDQAEVAEERHADERADPMQRIRIWRQLADLIAGGTLPASLVQTTFYLEPAATSAPLPELGLEPYIEFLRWRTDGVVNATELMDAAVRLGLIAQEIARRRHQ
jgi:tetratricopeptide (TPR) repeat protein